MSNLLKHLLGLGLKAYAQDAEPEKLAEAAEAIKKEEKKPEEPPAEKPPAKDPATDKKADDKRADGCHADDKHADDKRAADRARLHAALDKLLDKRAPAEDRPAEDADVEELRDLLDEFFEEEAEDPAHKEGEEEVPAGDRAAEDHRARDARGRDARGRDEFIEPVEESAPAATGDGMEILRALRPVVARSNDAAVRRAFNGLLAHHTRTSRASSASYAGFGGAARHRAADAGDDPGQKESESNRKLQAAYDAARTGKKEEK